ncbi:MAG: hypothetical protein ABGZ17_19950, partial [Planctomycetaceae bacterium]
KCHHNVVELGVNHEYGPTAPKVYEGFRIIEKYGCFGCHEIRGYDGLVSIGPDLRLEPATPEARAAAAADPTKIPGRMRKVGPSLGHIATKTSADWIQYWTEQPSRFRPTTRMPQFFNLSNQHDEVAHDLQPVELASIATYLTSKSKPLTLDHPHPAYKPNAQQGKTEFIQRGCLACHSHSAVPAAKADFGPDLTYVHEKLKRNADNSGFSDWLYTWVRNPERHHPRTKMPNLFLNEQSGDGAQIDPAADIVAFLLEGNARNRPATPDINTDDLDRLARLFLQKALTQNQVDGVLAQDGKYPFLGSASIKGDEIELVLKGSIVKVIDPHNLTVAFDPSAGGPAVGDELIWKTGELVNSSFTVSTYNATTGHLNIEPAMDTPPAKGDEFLVSTAITQSMKQQYVGRRTIGRYGCYGCHAIPGFETARPIGTALQDWGRKDTSKLAVEHIAEWLHHHGEPQPDGTQTGTHTRAEAAMRKTRAGGFAAGEFPSQAAEDRGLNAAFYYDNLLHHGRPGFIWQKLRQPRSYDYKKEETKGYDERLKMPKFPFDEDEIEKVATFVLGLVAEPPAEQYLFRPDGAKAARFAGEQLIEKYNCAACHMLDLPKLRYAEPELVRTGALGAPSSAAANLQPNQLRVGDISDTPGEPKEDLQFDHTGAAVKAGSHLQWTSGKLKGLTYVVQSNQDQVLTLDRRLSAQPAADDTFLLNNVVSDALDPKYYKQALDLLLKVRPPRQALTDRMVTIAGGENADQKPQSVPVLDLPGMLASKYDPEDAEEPLDKEYVFDLWHPMHVGDARWLPTKRLLVLEHRLQEIQAARGGTFAELLIKHLLANKTVAEQSKAWQMVPPPLVGEGRKVQTPWLYRFLKNPDRIRHQTILRMPKFNLSDHEAQTLANYFAAVDEAPYPYQSVPEREPPYLAQQNALWSGKLNGNDDYLTESWKILNGQVCSGCHSVGGFIARKDPKNPKQALGPALKNVSDRLRPEWAQLWIYSPPWVLPYTSMPQNFPANVASPFPTLFQGTAAAQNIAVRDALFNYHRLLERDGHLYKFQPPAAAAAAPGGDE